MWCLKVGEAGDGQGSGCKLGKGWGNGAVGRGGGGRGWDFFKILYIRKFLKIYNP